MDTTLRSRVAALLTVGVVALGALTAPAAIAAEAPAPDTVTLEGVLRVLPDESGMGTRAGTGETGNVVTLVTADGTAVDLTGDLDDAVTGARFSGAVAVDAEIAEVVEDVPSAEFAEAVAEAAADLETPLAVTDATITPMTAPAVAAKAHTVDVMYVNVAGYAQPAASDLDSAVARLSEYWSAQSDGQVSHVTRVNAARTVTLAMPDVCNAIKMWDYAAGPSGFNRTGYWGDPTAHYWYGPDAAHLVVLVPSVCGAGTGLGTVGSVDAGGLIWASVSETNAANWDQVVFHEFGHNLGLGHSNRATCSAPATHGPTCEVREYFDFYDVMGGGYTYGTYTNHRNVAALNASHKTALGALPRNGADPGLVTVSADGGALQSFTLAPASVLTGLRGLEVVDQHTGEKYYVEYRSGTGRDSASFYTAVTGRLAGYGAGIRVLTLDCECAGADSRVQPSPTGNMYFRAGETFTSGDGPVPAVPGARIAVLETGASATVAVSFGDDVGEVDAPAPVIRGNAVVGQTLTVDTAGWTGSLTYQWRRDSTVVASATGPTYLLGAADSGRAITVTVTSDAAGLSPQTSAPTAKIAAGTLTAGNPTTTGGAKVGSKLTVKPGTWTAGTTLTYQWLANGVAIAKAAGSTYTVRAADLNKTITVRVTGAKAGYTTVSKTVAVGKVARASLGTLAKPTISGTAKVGKKLTVTAKAPAGVTVKYQWMRGATKISGATTASYKARAADKGKKVAVKVTYSKAGYHSRAITTAGKIIAR